MKHVCIVVILITSAVAQTRSDAPSKFWTKQMIVAQSFSAGLHVWDAVQTCTSGRHEDFLPTQGCASNTALIAGQFAGSVALSYILNRSGHHRLATALPWISAGSTGIALTYSYWPRKQQHYVCNPNSTHADCHLE